MRKRKTALFLVLIGTLIVMGTGCTTLDVFKDTFQEETDEVIRIGVFEPLSGAEKENGKLEVAGIELAHELYPTVIGKKVELVYGDNKSSLEVARSVAADLATKNVTAILGSYGNTLTLAAGEIVMKEQIPLVAITCTNPLVTKGNMYMFRVCIVDSFQGVMAAQYVFHELGLDKAAVLKRQNDDIGAALAQQFSDEMALISGDNEAAAGFIEYLQGTEDFSDHLETLKDMNVKVAYLTGSAEESARIILQAREKGIDIVFLGTNLWETEEFLEIGGEALEDVVFTCYFDTDAVDTKTAEVFLKAYREKYGEDAQPTQAEALAFDAYLVTLAAIEKAANANGSDVQSALAKTSKFEGVTGNITLDENGDPIKSVAFKTVKNGEFVHKNTVEPNWE